MVRITQDNVDSREYPMASPGSMAKIIPKKRHNTQASVMVSSSRYQCQNASGQEPKSVRRAAYSFRKNKNLSKTSLVKLKGKIKRRVKKAFPRNFGSLFLKEHQPTWEQFLEEYRGGKFNLSTIERPQSFNDYGFMVPPEAFNEPKRTAESKTYMDKRKWNHTNYFYELCRPLMEEFNVSGISISLLDRTRQVVKFSINHPLQVISRNVSIDGHAILSKDSFVILDASRDWRILYNPMVHGPPFIRFYAAVPLVSKNNIAIGVLAIFDPYLRCSCSPLLIQRLSGLASLVVNYMEQPSSSMSPKVTPINSHGTDIARVQSKKSALNWKTSKDSLLGDNLDLGFNGLRKLDSPPIILHSFEISQELMNSPNASEAVVRAAQILGQALGLDLTYVVEVRKCSLISVSQKFLDKYSDGDQIDVPDAGMLRSDFEGATKIRLLGGHGLPNETMKFDRDVHSQVLCSEYGMHFDSLKYYLTLIISLVTNSLFLEIQVLSHLVYSCLFRNQRQRYSLIQSKEQ